MTQLRALIAAVQIITAFLTIGLILLQQKGVGLSAAFGGEGAFYRRRRGAEKIIFWITIASSFIFLVTSFVLAELI